MLLKYYILRDTCYVTVIVTRSGIGDPILKPGSGCLHFANAIKKGMNTSIITPAMGK